MRCSVALPREATREMVVDEHGEKITVKPGDEVVCNLVSLLSFSPLERPSALEKVSADDDAVG